MKVIKYFIMLLLFCIIIGIAGFGYFIYIAKSFPQDKNTATDAIIVLSGSNDKIEHGFKILKAGYAPIILIAGGIENYDDLSSLINKYNIANNQIIYQPNSKNTVDKIREVSNFVQMYSVRSIRLITGIYNMQRALGEIQKNIPKKVLIVIDPINEDWKFDSIFYEYKRYLEWILE
jgi:uncharacterized SAM-binding protein YcdF (DUF218 family)